MSPGFVRAALNVVLFAAVNAFFIKPESAVEWLLLSLVWALGILLAGVTVAWSER